LFHEGTEPDQATVHPWEVRIELVEGAPLGHGAVGAHVIVHGQADLLEVVGALGPSRGFASRLDRGQQEGDEDSDNGDDDEQLDEGEAACLGTGACVFHRGGLLR